MAFDKLLFFLMEIIAQTFPLMTIIVRTQHSLTQFAT